MTAAAALTGVLAQPEPTPESQSERTRMSSRLHLVPAPRWPTGPDPLTSGGPDGRFRPGTAVQPRLPLEFCLPNGLPAIPSVPEVVTRASRSSVVPWAARLAQAVLEVVAGERPVLQLTSWVHPDIYRRLERRHHLGARQRESSGSTVRSAETVRSVHVCHPTPEIAEVSVVTRGADRCRALAMRLERRKGRWFCTELDWA